MGHYIDTEAMERAASRMERAAESTTRSAERMEEAAQKLTVLLGEGYGNNAERLIQILTEDVEKLSQGAQSSHARATCAEADNKRLREALKPFAVAYDNWSGANAIGYFGSACRPAQFKEAAAAIQGL